jgi:hypothetical protein
MKVRIMVSFIVTVREKVPVIVRGSAIGRVGVFRVGVLYVLTCGTDTDSLELPIRGLVEGGAQFFLAESSII